MPDSTYFYGPTLATETDAVTGAPANTGYFKFYTTTAVAGAIATTASVPVLYNPAASGVVAPVTNLTPIRSLTPPRANRVGRSQLTSMFARFLSLKRPGSRPPGVSAS